MRLEGLCHVYFRSVSWINELVPKTSLIANNNSGTECWC